MSSSILTIGLSFTEARKVFEALAFAADKHRNQRRKEDGVSPYINHPIALANMLVSEGGIIDHVVLCAAILHGTIEDAGSTHEELVSAFGREIAEVVAEVTGHKTLDPAVRDHLQIQHGAPASVRAKLVKLADMACTLRNVAASPPPEWTDERRRAYFDWANTMIAGVRGTNAALDAAFENAFAARLEPARSPDGPLM